MWHNLFYQTSAPSTSITIFAPFAFFSFYQLFLQRIRRLSRWKNWLQKNRWDTLCWLLWFCGVLWSFHLVFQLRLAGAATAAEVAGPIIHAPILATDACVPSVLAGLHVSHAIHGPRAAVGPKQCLLLTWQPIVVSWQQCSQAFRISHAYRHGGRTYCTLTTFIHTVQCAWDGLTL